MSLAPTLKYDTDLQPTRYFIVLRYKDALPEVSLVTEPFKQYGDVYAFFQIPGWYVTEYNEIVFTVEIQTAGYKAGHLYMEGAKQGASHMYLIPDSSSPSYVPEWYMDIFEGVADSGASLLRTGAKAKGLLDFSLENLLPLAGGLLLIVGGYFVYDKFLDIGIKRKQLRSNDASVGRLRSR